MHQMMKQKRKYQRARQDDWNTDVDCAADELHCPHTELCIPKRLMCDGVSDCFTESVDERNCTACNNGAKKCELTGTCIPSASLCNGVKDRSDGSDEHDCECAQCMGPDRALCSNGRCISSKYVCDGVIDCEDASDEQHCPTSCGAMVNATSALPPIVNCESGNYPYASTRHLLADVCIGKASHCPSNELCPEGCDDRVSFICKERWSSSEQCIPKSKVCDGKNDCWYGEDEKDCLKACQKYPFFMRVNQKRSKCISMESRCDGVFDFADGSNEKNCEKCPSTAFRCDGGCIPSSSRCDAVKDCKDGSDEKNCSCEDCTSGRLDTYSCEATRTCLKRSDACGRGPRSLCPRPTPRDELFCVGEARRNK
ncbi:hypothetical protein PENTCL1PPCAC_7527 [Pristionchus entomophagus]|uniref:Lipoprotein receptor n=1 Tax=Pristionchus entomophagus TaxID=358040 RepID=A0AAV5SSD0_9BILA|nr:hypothetical protein PENTCL1PPCAC_7527 [Pristionchus entomophagus]